MTKADKFLWKKISHDPRSWVCFGFRLLAAIGFIIIAFWG